MDFSSLWNLQGQLFALLVVGLLLRKVGLFNESAKTLLTDLVLYVTLPCSIVLSFQIDINAELFVSLSIIFLISTAIQMFCYLLTRFTFRKVEMAKRSVLHYGILVSNAGFLGLPIAGELFGAAGLMYASIYLIPQRVVMWTAGLSIFSPAAANKKQAARKVILHPCMVAVYVGLILMVTRLPIPAFARMTLSSLGNCTTALSMLLIGSLFAEMKKEHLHLDVNLLQFSLLRLVLIPLVSLLAGRILGIDRLLIGVGVILAAMPGGSSTVILASKYGRDTTYASKLVIISTLLSLVSIPFWGMIL
ncbi:AEC family transporter [Sphaerochaeta globosa]|uniref:Auxin Efflux Carrier n=1 Tax=Sphaerochaeta globosa (strain ATCC BAA-1886 / DSM 22777 / Buddy) TaxID=158189 RepID=F0RXH6_SPHGB|nr:AEC family transporter [Sphaerochaeta globosa]ADY12026.1 Auxin Efflux Carrier [Sphaerochaeta globosa str. Buddy]